MPPRAGSSFPQQELTSNPLWLSGRPPGETRLPVEKTVEYAQAQAGSPPAAAKRIAWDAVSFLIPPNWELAVYKAMRRGVTRVEIEDEYSIRMEAEWVRPGGKLRMENILARYELRSKQLTARADSHEAIEGLPAGWHATHYILSETTTDRKKPGLQIVKHGLVTAFHLCPGTNLFCFLVLHFLPGDKEDPAKVINLVASDFRDHGRSELIPWALYDIAFEVPREFLLENTLFDIGAKLMIFRWKLRRFYLWHFSCADMFIKDGVVPQEWVAAYINDSRLVRGGSFRVGEDGEIAWKRRRRHLIAYRDELARWCFRYKVNWRLDADRNRLIAWVFNYRNPEDLLIIPPCLSGSG